MGDGISIAVIGGGIGGLTAALCLHKSGFDVHVYEQTRALREVGAGINITPNATRVIASLGLDGELAKLGVMPLAVHQRRWDDGKRHDAELGEFAVEPQAGDDASGIRRNVDAGAYFA